MPLSGAGELAKSPCFSPCLFSTDLFALILWFLLELRAEKKFTLLEFQFNSFCLVSTFVKGCTASEITLSLPLLLP